MFNFAHRLLQSRPLSPSQGPMVAWQPQIPPRSVRSGPPHQMASMFGLHRLCAKKDETGPTEPGYPCPLTTQTTSMGMSEIKDLYSAWRHFWGRIQGQEIVSNRRTLLQWILFSWSCDCRTEKLFRNCLIFKNLLLLRQFFGPKTFESKLHYFSLYACRFSQLQQFLNLGHLVLCLLLVA